MKRSALALVAVALTLTLAIASLAFASSDSSGERTAAVTTEQPSTGIEPLVAETIGQAEVAADVGEYLHAVEVQQVADYLVAVDASNRAAYAAVVAEREAEARAAYLRSLPAPAPARVPSYSAPAPSSGATGACGGATNGADQFIMRESGGNPNALNPSGAWGCYQIMPGTWSGAGCNELGAYGSASAAVQAQCASRLGLSAWNL